MCDEWRLDPWSFLDWLDANGWNKKLSVDRIDNDGPYSPANCRLADHKSQVRNQRSTRRVTFGGVSKPLAEWADELGVAYDTLKRRLQRGWAVEKALTAPVRK